jgi:hypothetical protein
LSRSAARRIRHDFDFFGPAQAHRVIGQELALRRGDRGDVWRNAVHQQPIAGHGFFEIGVRPVSGHRYAAQARQEVDTEGF